jgi:hypothetical protein
VLANHPRRILLALCLLVLGALGLRLASTDRLLPEFREPDAFETLEMQHQQGDPAIVKHVVFRERYPWLLAWTLALIPHQPAPDDAGLAEHLELAADPYERVRIGAALLATLQVALTFCLARRFLPPEQSLLASLLVGTSLLHMLFSVQARPHGPHAGLALLSLIASLRLMERPSAARAVLASLASTSAIAMLQLGYSTIPPLGLACVLAAGKSWRWRLGALALLPATAILLAQLWYTNRPYIDAEGLHLASASGGGHTLFLSQMDFLGSLRGARMFFEHDPLFAVLSAAGLSGALVAAWPAWQSGDRVWRSQVAVAAGFALPYLAVITIQGEVYERFLMPLLPFLALFGAWAFFVVFRAHRGLQPLAVLLLLGPCLIGALRFARVARAENGYEQAAAWLMQNAGTDERIVHTPDLTVPLLHSREALEAQLADPASANMPWITYSATIMSLPAGERLFDIRPFPARLSLPSFGPDRERMREWLRENRVRWLVLEISQRNARRPILQSLEDAARDLGTLVFVSRGSGPGIVGQGSLDYQAIEEHALRQIDQTCAGPLIRIYRIER